MSVEETTSELCDRRESTSRYDPKQERFCVERTRAMTADWCFPPEGGIFSIQDAVPRRTGAASAHGASLHHATALESPLQFPSLQPKRTHFRTRSRGAAAGTTFFADSSEGPAMSSTARMNRSQADAILFRHRRAEGSAAANRLLRLTDARRDSACSTSFLSVDKATHAASSSSGSHAAASSADEFLFPLGKASNGAGGSTFHVKAVSLQMISIPPPKLTYRDQWWADEDDEEEAQPRGYAKFVPRFLLGFGVYCSCRLCCSVMVRKCRNCSGAGLAQRKPGRAAVVILCGRVCDRTPNAPTLKLPALIG